MMWVSSIWAKRGGVFHTLEGGAASFGRVSRIVAARYGVRQNDFVFDHRNIGQPLPSVGVRLHGEVGARGGRQVFQEAFVVPRLMLSMGGACWEGGHGLGALPR